MSPQFILISFIAYTALLFTISFITSRKSNNQSFFVGNRKSPWPIVAYGMIGASLSGVTFISVPGWVGESGMTYMVMVLGYLLGYAVIAKLLLPIYYKLNLTSIYEYLQHRFGKRAYQSGSLYFLLSRIVGASGRLYLVVIILQEFVFKHWNIPFAFTVIIFLLLIFLYTVRAGIKTIVWTDTLQTTFMLAAVVIAFYFVADYFQMGMSELGSQIMASDYSRMWETDFLSSKFYGKQLLGGMFVAIAMTGLDQDMMQKNLSCRNIKDAQKNMLSMSTALVPINFIFLALGAALFMFATSSGMEMPDRADKLFAAISINEFGVVMGLVFVIGLIAAAYSSADSALTSLTTVISLDFFKLNKRDDLDEKQKERLRKRIHLLTTVLIFFTIMAFKAINKRSVVDDLFTAAGYTYGPLLGLFAVGLFTKWEIKGKWIPIVVVVAPLLTFGLASIPSESMGGYHFGYELLLVNGIFTFMGLFFIKKVASATPPQ